MQPLKKRADNLRQEIAEVWQNLSIDAKSEQLAIIDEQLADSQVWVNVERAQSLSKQAAALRASVEPWQTLRAQAEDIRELMQIGDSSMVAEFTQQLEALEQELVHLKKDLLFDGQYDDHNAILRISAGVGGTDAQDWAEMLERMYLRWAEKSQLTTKIVERSVGEEAGIKTSVI